MQADQIQQICNQFDELLQKQDWQALHLFSDEIKGRLGQALPQLAQGSENTQLMVEKLEHLASRLYSAASIVQDARDETKQRLLAMDKSKKNTNKYLDIARNLSL